MKYHRYINDSDLVSEIRLDIEQTGHYSKWRRISEVKPLNLPW